MQLSNSLCRPISIAFHCFRVVQQSSRLPLWVYRIISFFPTGKASTGESVENSSHLTELLSGWLRAYEGAARRLSAKPAAGAATSRQVAPAADSIANNYC
jgi:hypothetical protein